MPVGTCVRCTGVQVPHQTDRPALHSRIHTHSRLATPGQNQSQPRSQERREATHHHDACGRRRTHCDCRFAIHCDRSLTVSTSECTSEFLSPLVCSLRDFLLAGGAESIGSVVVRVCASDRALAIGGATKFRLKPNTTNRITLISTHKDTQGRAGGGPGAHSHLTWRYGITPTPHACCRLHVYIAV